MTVPLDPKSQTLRRVLANVFSLDEMKLLCSDAGIDPESVPYIERGKEVFAYCIVQAFRHKALLSALHRVCADARPNIGIDWDTLLIEVDVPADWSAWFQAERFTSINTQGGANIQGNVKVEPNGTFIGRDNVTNNITHIIQQPEGYKFVALHELRVTRDTFTGRVDEIDKLIALVRKERDNVSMTTCYCITGMGGVGKSELANVIAHALSTDYPDAQLWLDLGANSIKPVRPKQALERVLRAYTPEAKLPDDLVGLRNLYQQQLSGKRALVVLDDVRDDDDLAELLPPIGCIALVTSRRALVTGTVRHLDSLQPSDSVKLLRQFRAGLTEVDANALAELCGYLPIALIVTGSYLKQKVTVTVDRYLAALRSTPFKTLRFGESEKNNVEVVLAHSVNQLSIAERRVWRTLSLIPADFDRVAGIAVSGVPDDMLDHPLDTLVMLNLLNYDEQTERFSWHDLLQQFAQHLMSGLADDVAIRRAARERYIVHYIQVARLANDLYLEGQQLTGLALFDRESNHIEAAFVDLIKSVDPVADCAIRIIELVDATAYTGDLRFHPRKRIEWLQAQVAAARRIGSRDGEGAGLGNLGNAYVALGQARKALEYHKQDLAIQRELGNLRGEGTALGGLGNAYAYLGETHKAIEAYEQARVIFREIIQVLCNCFTDNPAC